uniref:Uncharacterized protein n=1 Tax=Papio anubis TaxID=9555 RepID=A0A8I5NRU4_PAPAN
MRGRERAPTESRTPSSEGPRSPLGESGEAVSLRGRAGRAAESPTRRDPDPAPRVGPRRPPLLQAGTSHAAGDWAEASARVHAVPSAADAGRRGAVGTGPHPQGDQDPLAGPRGIAAGAKPPVPPEAETKSRRKDPRSRPRTLRSPARSRHTRGRDPRPVRRPGRPWRRLTSDRRLAAPAPRRRAWADWSTDEQPTEPRQPQQWSPGAGPLRPLQPVFPAEDPAWIKELQLGRGCGRETHFAGAHGPTRLPPPRPQRSRAPRARPPANGERAARRGRGLGEQREVGRGGAGTGRVGSCRRTEPRSWPDPGLLEDPAQRPPGVCSTGRAHLKLRTQAFRAESERQASFTKRETEV